MNIVFVNGIGLRAGAVFACLVAVAQQRQDAGRRVSVADERPPIVGVDVKAVEADAVEDLPVFLAQRLIEGLGGGQELDERCHQLGDVVKLGSVGFGELCVDVLAPGAEVSDFGCEFLDGPVGVPEQFEDLVFECVQAGSFAFEVAAERRGRLVVAAGHAFEAVFGRRCFGRGQCDGGVVGRYGVFDVTDGEAGQIA